jgi:IS30 family transposase
MRKKLAERDISVTQLASQINRPRETVSRAIHQQKYPKVLAQIREVLYA